MIIAILILFMTAITPILSIGQDLPYAGNKNVENNLRSQVASNGEADADCLKQGQHNNDCAFTCCKRLVCRSPEGHPDAVKSCERPINEEDEDIISSS